MAIALSGSNPAYVLLRDMAQELAIQIILGSARTVERADEHPADLRNTVASQVNNNFFS